MNQRTLHIFTMAILCLTIIPATSADEVTFYGDFEDGFATPAITYDSATPYDPGAFVPIYHEMVVGIPKFAPTLGTLTGIEVFIETPGFDGPVFYTLAGGMTVTEVDPLDPMGYGGDISFVSELMLSYGEGPAITPLFADAVLMSGGDSASMGTGSLMTAITSDGDGVLTGSASVFGSVDLADFVGSGFVDSLFIDLFVEDTADFMLDNATATATFGFDIFDGDSGTDDAVIGVTYTFTAVPEPGSAGFVAITLGAMFFRRRRLG